MPRTSRRRVAGQLTTLSMAMIVPFGSPTRQVAAGQQATPPAISSELISPDFPCESHAPAVYVGREPHFLQEDHPEAIERGRHLGR